MIYCKTMSDYLDQKRENLKRMILKSLLVDGQTYQRIGGLLDNMNDEQLSKVERLFWQAEQKKNEILHILADANPDAFVQGISTVTKKIQKNAQIQGVASLGREILKKSLKN